MCCDSCCDLNKAFHPDACNCRWVYCVHRNIEVVYDIVYQPSPNDETCDTKEEDIVIEMECAPMEDFNNDAYSGAENGDGEESGR
jgi:hypothetical protein